MSTVKLWNAETGRARLVTLRPEMRIATCGNCGRSWDDARVTGVTPTPGGRCPFEYMTGHGAGGAVEPRTRPTVAPVEAHAELVEGAIEHLRIARDLLTRADAPRARERVRLALTSAGGALRHAERRRGGVGAGLLERARWDSWDLRPRSGAADDPSSQKSGGDVA